MILAGLDIGTTGAKLNVFSDASFLKTFYRAYPCLRNGERETIDIESLTKAVCSLLRESLAEYPDLAGVGVSSFGEAFVMLNENDKPLYDCMLYSDPRGRDEAKEIEQAFGEEYLFAHTGQAANPMFSLEKLLYVKKHHPEIFQQTKRIQLIEDYVVYLLSGVAQIDYSLASRTQCFDVFKKVWIPGMLDHFGIPVSLFSKPVPTGTIAGPLSKKAQERLGVSSSLKIVSIAHDQIANLVGSMVTEKGSATEGLGTCECIAPVFGEDADVRFLAKKGYGMIPFFDSYVCYEMVNTSGALISWFLDLFGADKEELNRLSKSIIREPVPELFHPHFAGAGTPHNDPLMTGSISGLRLGTTKERLFQSMLQGLAFESRLNIECLREAKVEIKELFASGGGARNDAWLQMKADVLGLPVHQLEKKDAGALGSVAILGYALGAFPSIEEAARKMNRVEKTYYSDPKIHEAYEPFYQAYLKESKR